MRSEDLFSNYVEALVALHSLDRRQRDALRNAIERSAKAQEQVKTTVADQQRMYDRVARDADAAGLALDRLRAALGASAANGPASSPRPNLEPSLKDIRRQIHQVAEWAAENRPVAESLLRTKARLAEAARPRVAPSPTPVGPNPARRPRMVPTALVVAVLVVIVLVAVVIAVSR